MRGSEEKAEICGFAVELPDVLAHLREGHPQEVRRRLLRVMRHRLLGPLALLILCDIWVSGGV